MKQSNYDICRLFFKAFSNRTRFEIINLLKKESLTVTEICAKLDFEQSRVSHNLKCLENCGFVNVKSNGKYRKYSLDKKTVSPMLKLLDNHSKNYKNGLMKCEVLKV